MGIDAGSLHLTAVLQAGNCNQTTWQYTNWDNATHVVQPKHQHVFVQHHWFPRRLKQNMQLEYGNECRFAPSFILKQAITTKQPTSKQSVTTRPKWCNPNIDACVSNTTGLHGGWGKIMGMNARLHYLDLFSFPQSSWAPQVEYIFHSYSAYLISQLIALRSVCLLLPVFYFI